MRQKVSEDGWSQADCEQKTDLWIGTPHRVKLDIYLVGYRGGREKGRERERREKLKLSLRERDQKG